MTEISPAPRRGLFQRFLSTVEWLGNLLPHPVTLFAIISGIIVTAIYLVGLVIRSRRTIRSVGVDSILVMAVYILTIAVFFSFR